MKSMIGIIVTALAALAPFIVAAQVPNEGLANAVIAARQKNAGLLQQYNWNCRTEVLENNQMKDLRIDLVSMGPNGMPQRTLLNDQQAQLPGGFLRHAIAESQQQQLEELVKGLSGLVDQYTLPGPGKVASFLIQSQVQPITTPQGATALQVNGSNVVVPGDTFSMMLNGTTLLPTSIQISTTFKDDQVTLSGTFNTMANGLNRLQYATVQMPSKHLVINIHNYDFVPAN
ncbi:MAG: hypothetical protein U0572_01405 [Phycisphaerales bacterium]